MRFFKREKKSPANSYGAGARTRLLNTIRVYAEAMCYLTTCGPFDVSKFEKLDEILSKAGVSFGPEKRQEMLSRFRHVLPMRTVGGGRAPALEHLRVILIEDLAVSIRTFNEILVKVSPTPVKDAEEVARILLKYRARAGNEKNGE